MLFAIGVYLYEFGGCGREPKHDHEIKFAKKPEVYLDVLQTRLDGRAGFHTKAATKRLLKRLDEIKPDVVHLHNLHGYYVNIEMLFNWLAAQECKVEWTLHDCWAFTGHCTYFTYAECKQWQSCCASEKTCPLSSEYPRTLSKSSCSWNFNEKQRVFNLISAERMLLISPSKWLATLAEKSFLKKYVIEVRPNTINTSVFKPTPSDFRERYGIGNRIMILGVASPWNERKGLGDFLELARNIDHTKYAVVLVGLSKKQIDQFPPEVICLGRTDSSQELAGIYTAADVFFNPTKEDNFPTVNLEAEACGTPVLTYDVGGCAETISSKGSRCIDSWRFFIERRKIS